MFGDDDLRAMESDMGVPVLWRGASVGPCLFTQRMVTADDGSGFPVQRRAQVLRVRAGLLNAKRDDPITIDGRAYRIREKMDDPQVIDGAWDMWSVGQ